jgi:hypothetical protein
MRTAWMRLFFMGAFSVASCFVLRAQEVIHALTGVVTFVDRTTKSIGVQTSDGGQNVFSYANQPQDTIAFDKNIRAGAIEPDVYNKVSDHVIVYFYGGSDRRTVVAIRDLGKVPLQISTGTVINGSRKHHILEIKTEAGVSESYQISKDTSIETPEGVIGGLNFDPMRNSRVIVKYSGTAENRVAEFVREY